MNIFVKTHSNPSGGWRFKQNFPDLENNPHYVMVLASRPPVDPDDVNILTRQIFDLSLSNFI